MSVDRAALSGGGPDGRQKKIDHPPRRASSSPSTRRIAKEKIMGNEDQQTGDAEQPIVLPEVTVEGAPPDIAADPQKLVIYEAFQDGYVAGTSGQPKQYV